MKYSIYQPLKHMGTPKTEKASHTAQHSIPALQNQTHSSGQADTSNLLEQVMSGLAWNG